MSISLYDTLSQEARLLQKNEQGDFRFYCCGPTVYAAAHIGNFRTFVIQDVLRRLLELEKLNPIHVRNITDVDDKTIRQSQAEGKTLIDFTSYWRKVFEADCERLNLLMPHTSPSVADHISHQIDLIRQLIERRHAYESDDGVYFKVTSFPKYGELARLDLSALVTQNTNSAGENNQADEYTKDHVADFALWKKHKPQDGENSWESPWGRGRPGWHIECSAMCVAHLGETIDLHGGGVDLIFPHHVNEIAQSEGATGKPFSKHWFHVAHLKVEGEKMSKSLGNLFTLQDLIDKGYTPETVRYLLISGYYRQPLNFTFDGLHAAKKALERIDQFIKKVLKVRNQSLESWDEVSPLWPPTVFQSTAANLCDDLKTPQALGSLFSELHALESEDRLQTAGLLESLKAILYALGLSGLQSSDTEIQVPENISALAEKRWQAKCAKDFASADLYRKELHALGWTMLDHANSYTVEPLEQL